MGLKRYISKKHIAAKIANPTKPLHTVVAEVRQEKIAAEQKEASEIDLGRTLGTLEGQVGAILNPPTPISAPGLAPPTQPLPVSHYTDYKPEPKKAEGGLDIKAMLPYIGVAIALYMATKGG